MDIKTLSASAAQQYEACPAGFKANYIDRTPNQEGYAGQLGSACHEALEIWVNTGQHEVKWPTIMDKEKAMNVIWNSVYWDYFSDEEAFATGWGMLAKWVQNMEWWGREVISTEEKDFFELKTSRGPLKVNFIMDRLDLRDNGDYEVVDYKTVIAPISSERMKVMIQPRLYATAARIKYNVPADKLVWVTYDLLRYSRVSVSFTRDECAATYRYLLALAERMYADDGSLERLNPECQYCVRKLVCETLKRHSDGGGVLGITSMAEATDRRAQVEFAKKANEAALRELDEILMTMARNEEIYEWESDTNVGGITAKGQRQVDSERVSHLLGPELMHKYGKVGVGTVEEILKKEELSDEVKSQLRQMIKDKVYGNPYIYTKPKTPFQGEV